MQEEQLLSITLHSFIAVVRQLTGLMALRPFHSPRSLQQAIVTFGVLTQKAFFFVNICYGWYE